jgi:DNA-damage-inducible protein J
MSTVNLTIRMEENLKKQAEEFFNELGMSLTTAYTVFTKAALRKRKIPFEIAADSDPFYSAENQAYLLRAAAALDAGKGREHDLIEVDDE